ncbi:MAG: 50S ribosomal protein L17 [Clostridia bacterium]|nr:50S ribosomal protein L17 [Clostridia bacterium]
MPKKLGKRTDQRLALLKNQVSELLWYGQISTTVDRAKAVRSLAEKYITIAMRAYKDEVKVTKTVSTTNAKGEKSQNKVEFVNDGPKKLNARRRLMAELVDIKEIKGEKESKAAFSARIKDTKHPLIEKMFKEYAPKYDARKEELGQGGGYTRILKTGNRRGDAAETCILKLI